MRPALAAESLDLPVGSQSGFAKLRFANNSVLMGESSSFIESSTSHLGH